MKNFFPEIAPPPKKRKVTWWILSLCVPLLLLTLAWSLPTLLSSSWGLRILEEKIGDKTGGKVHIGSAKLRWGEKQTLSDVNWLNKQEDLLIHISHFQSGATLWSLLWGERNLGVMEIEGATLALIQTDPPAGASGNDSSSQIHTTSLDLWPLPLLGSLEITGGQLVRQTHSQREILLENLHGKLVASSSSLDGSLRASSPDGGESSALFSLHRDGRWKGALQGDELSTKALDGVATWLWPRSEGVWQVWLGPVLDFAFEGSGEGGKAFAHASAQSNNLTLAFEVDYDRGMLTLSQPLELESTLSSLLTQKLLTLYLPGNRVSVVSDIHLALHSNELVLPLHPSPLLCGRSCVGEISISSSPITLLHSSLDTWTIKGLTASLHRNEADHPLAFTVSLPWEDTKQRGGFALQGDWDPTTARLASGRLSARVEQLPTRWAARLSPFGEIWPYFLGPYWGCSLSAKGSWQEGEALFSTSCDAFSVQKVPLQLSTALILKEPITFAYRLPQWGQDRLLQPTREALFVDQMAPIAIQIDALHLPLPFDYEKARLEGTLHSDSISVRELPNIAGLHIGPLTASLHGESLAKSELLLEGEASLLGEEWVSRFFGRNHHLILRASPRLTPPHRGVVNALLTWQSEILHLKTGGEWWIDQALALTQPTHCEYRLHPLHKGDGPQFSNTITADLLLSPLTLRLLDKQYEPSDFTLQGEIKGVSVTDRGGAPLADIEDFQIEAHWSKGANLLTGRLFGQTSSHQGKGVAEGHCRTEGLFAGGELRWQAATTRAHLAIERVSTTILDAIWGSSLLSDALGESFSLEAEAQLAQSLPAQGCASFQLNSPRLQSAAQVQLAETFSLTGTPASLSWDLSPAAFSKLQRLAGQERVALAEPLQVELELDSLQWPWLNGWLFDPREVGAKGKLTLTHCTYGPADTAVRYPLDKLSWEFDALALTERITHTLSLHYAPSLGGSLSSKGVIDPLFQFDGLLNRYDIATQGTLESLNLPLHALYPLLPLSLETKQQLNALLGERLTLQSRWQIEGLSGPLDLQLESTHSRAQLAAQVIAGTLTLRQPFSAQLEVTPYLGTAVLGKLNPLLTTAISSESPIHVRIAKDEFALPLSPWNPTGIRMQSGRLNLGKIALRNEGMVLRLLNLLNSSAAQEPILYAWFTPLPASILEGTMRLDRMDALLASRLHIATWGRYAIPTQRVDLNVAIAGESLRKILDEPTIQDDDYLVIPMYGPAGHLSIDWLQAGAQLTALKAQAKGGKKALFGTVLDIVSGSSKKRAQIPPPPPLPWQ